MIGRSSSKQMAGLVRVSVGESSAGRQRLMAVPTSATYYNTTSSFSTASPSRPHHQRHSTSSASCSTSASSSSSSSSSSTNLSCTSLAQSRRTFRTAAIQRRAPSQELLLNLGEDDRPAPLKEVTSPQITPKESIEDIQKWFAQQWPTIRLPDDVLLQAITHETWNYGLGAGGHNRRLGFLGRRAMRMFLSMFFFEFEKTAVTNGGTAGAASSQKALRTDETISTVLNTVNLGFQVGKALRLVEIMRWRAASPDGQARLMNSGMFKIRGTVVEALVGAIYHQYGAAVAQAFFESQVLPIVRGVPKEMEAAVEERVAKGQQLLQALP